MKQSFRHYFLVFLAVAVAALAGYTIVIVTAGHKSVAALPQNLADRFQRVQVYNPPAPVPDIALRGQDGVDTTMTAHGGAWRLVNFWATWCPGCIIELPTLVALQQSRESKDFQVVFVSMDFPSSIGDLKIAMAQVGIPASFYTYYTSDMEIWGKISLIGLPTTLVIDPQNRIRYSLMGEIDWMSKESLDFIDDLVDNP